MIIAMGKCSTVGRSMTRQYIVILYNSNKCLYCRISCCILLCCILYCCRYCNCFYWTTVLCWILKRKQFRPTFILFHKTGYLSQKPKSQKFVFMFGIQNKSRQVRSVRFFVSNEILISDFNLKLIQF